MRVTTEHELARYIELADALPPATVHAVQTLCDKRAAHTDDALDAVVGALAMVKEGSKIGPAVRRACRAAEVNRLKAWAVAAPTGDEVLAAHLDRMAAEDRDRTADDDDDDARLALHDALDALDAHDAAIVGAVLDDARRQANRADRERVSGVVGHVAGEDYVTRTATLSHGIVAEAWQTPAGTVTSRPGHAVTSARRGVTAADSRDAAAGGKFGHLRLTLAPVAAVMGVPVQGHGADIRARACLAYARLSVAMRPPTEDEVRDARRAQRAAAEGRCLTYVRTFGVRPLAARSVLPMRLSVARRYQLELANRVARGRMSSPVVDITRPTAYGPAVVGYALPLVVVAPREGSVVDIVTAARAAESVAYVTRERRAYAGTGGQAVWQQDARPGTVPNPDAPGETMPLRAASYSRTPVAPADPRLRGAARTLTGVTGGREGRTKDGRPTYAPGAVYGASPTTPLAKVDHLAREAASKATRAADRDAAAYAVRDAADEGAGETVRAFVVDSAGTATRGELATGSPCSRPIVTGDAAGCGCGARDKGDALIRGSVVVDLSPYSSEARGYLNRGEAIPDKVTRYVFRHALTPCPSPAVGRGGVVRCGCGRKRGALIDGAHRQG